MDKEMLAALQKKPSIYTDVWIHIFITSNTLNEWEGGLIDLIERFAITKTTAHRITTFSGWGANKVSRVRNGNNLSIRFLTASSGTDSQQDTGKKPPRKMSKELFDHQQRCLDIYYAFYKNRVLIPPKIDGAQMIAIRSMMAYFKQVATEKTNEAVYQCFHTVFSNWEVLSKHLKAQLKLTQINSNLPNILAEIRQHANKSTAGGAGISSKARSQHELSKSMDDIIKNNSETLRGKK